MKSNESLNIFGALLISAIATVILFITGHWGIGIVTGIISVILWSVIKDE
jgi:hypothetical protein